MTLVSFGGVYVYSEDDFTAYSLGAPLQNGTQVVYSKYAGTEVEFNGANHLILKEDDIVGILETDDIKDLKPLNDRVLIKVGLALVILFLPSVWRYRTEISDGLWVHL